VLVLGLDPANDAPAVKDRVGVSLQATNLPDKMTVHEAIELFAAFYSRQASLELILKRFQLWEKRNSMYSTLSGGQKQRLALALALVNEPTIVFLDEPTTGLDPQVRLEIHNLILELKAAKTTILLTTHYIEEAERLCDRVAIIDEGRIVAMDSPQQLQQNVLGYSRVEIACESPIPAGAPAGWPAEYQLVFSEDRKHLSVPHPKPAKAVLDLVKWIDGAGVVLDDLHIRRPTLEDVFIELTGKSLRD
jgi:ABC-2 type transport system ATP-binding protein